MKKQEIPSWIWILIGLLILIIGLFLMYNQGETYTTKSVEGDKIVTTTYTKASETTGDIYEPLLEVCKSKQLACEMSQEKGDTISRYEGVNCNKVFEDCIAG